MVDVEQLEAFVEAGARRSAHLDGVAAHVEAARARTVASLGYAVPAVSRRPLAELDARIRRSNRFVETIATSMRDTSRCVFEAGSLGSEAVGAPSGPIPAQLTWPFETVVERSEAVARALARSGVEVAEHVDRAADAADDAVVEAIPVMASVPEWVGLATLGPAYGPVADGINRRVTPVLVAAAWSELDRWLPGSNAEGDRGGTFTARPTGLRSAEGSDEPTQAGLAVVIGALNDTADGDRVRPDEFQIVRNGPTTYTVVLPGVVDLSAPTAGLDHRHRSSRDTDVAAALSASSAKVADNVYASLVVEALRRNGVPPGSELLLVGHSFGADTAVDLAADPHFNGELYTVTHVVAAAYHSEPQLRSVPEATDVLVLQNNKDVPVMVENFGHLSRNPVEEFVDGPSHILVREFDGGWRGFGHHQANYTSYLNDHDHDAQSLDFFAALAVAGYAGSGPAEAIDVSIPEF